MKHFLNLESPLIRFLSSAVDIVILNTLFLLTSIPLFTIGASLTASYAIALRIVRNENKGVVKEYFLLFKRDFKQSTIVWLGLAIIGIFFTLDYQLVMMQTGIFKFFFLSVLIVFSLICLSFFILVFPYIARFSNNLHDIFKNVFIIGISNFGYLLLLLLLVGVPAFVFLSSPEGLLTGIYVWTFGGVALGVVINAYFIQRIFRKYEIARD